MNDYGHALRAALIRGTGHRSWAARVVNAAGRLYRALQRRAAPAPAGLMVRPVRGGDGLLYLSPGTGERSQLGFRKQG
ncbi:hypothetical protein GPA22_22100 [Aromatoleum toluvorans]|uniref:Uncharacterized protein n=1 Tax=Aromatoleum toluvorans TaxID=92002 RepID=A0ABX1Q3Y7_9RHOO|nr:hypothetical protein [Aromatoleum toluvorans]NMG46414.1 hypothetical protein [Aromatoleum toluvorans]